MITVLAGFPPHGTLSHWDAQGGAPDSYTRIAERREEDRQALLRSGSEYMHLDFPDTEYVALGVAVAPTVSALASALRDHLRAATAVFAPSALSANSRSRLRRRRRLRHSDHWLVRDAVIAVRPDATLYADLPYALSPDRGFSLPRDIDRTRRQEQRMELSEELVAEKIESVRCYGTQLEQLTRIFGDFTNAGGLGLEVHWDVGGRRE